MAERRMFSKRVVNSARFLKMPPSTQNLYFHLGLNADDDGVVEAYTVMNLVGATEDDLRILVTKKFIVILNDDLVAYITDWIENNKLRADRKIDSMYQDLLIQMIPDIKLLEKKERADRKKTRDVPGTTNGPHRIGKDRIGKYSIYMHDEEKMPNYNAENNPKYSQEDIEKELKLLNDEINEKIYKRKQNFKGEVTGK